MIGTSDLFSSELGKFKSFTSRKIVDRLKLSGSSLFLQDMLHLKKRHKTDQMHQLWQEGSHLIAITNEETLRQKTENIRHNPVKRGYVTYPEHWRYWSAQNYSGQVGLIPVQIVP